MNYTRKTILLIITATVLRSVAAMCLELGNDEVYYRMYAQYLQWNYFDHPPIVGWLIRLTTVNLFFDTEFFIRLGAILSAAVTTWLIFLSGRKLTNAYTGFLAAIIYTASIYGSIIAGTFILPDSPQMICWSAGLYLLIGITKYSHINRVKKRRILLFGIVAGIGMLCKIHTVFLWFGLLLYVILYNRQWLKEPVFYLSGIITLLFFYPVIQWNINNHFVTYLYHSERVNVIHSGIDISSFLGFMGGQVLYCNPIIFLYIILALAAAFKNDLPLMSSQKKLLLCCSLPLILIAASISLFKNVLPHWTGPAWTGLILLSACYFSKRTQKTGLKKSLIPKPLLFACSFQVLLIALGIMMINFIPGTLGKKDKLILGDGDFTLDMFGWRDLKKSFEMTLANDRHSGIMKNNAVIISNKWFPASHIDYYVAMPLKKDLVAIGDTNSIHQYAWINKERSHLQAGDDAYCIVPSDNYVDVKELYGSCFATILPYQVSEQKRNGKVCRYFYIWRLKNFIKKESLPIK